MWRKLPEYTFHSVGFLSLCVLVLLAPTEGYGQASGAPHTSFDRTTQNSLNQLDRLILLGDRQKIEEHLNRVIHSSGYIWPLAEYFYKLTQSEADGETLERYYGTLIDKYPHSAWAQKAVVEFVPLLLMSGGNLGRKVEPVLSEREADLLSLAEDTASIGEDPELLRADVLLNLIYLAHYRGEIGRIESYAQQEFTSISSIKPVVELAHAYADFRAERRVESINTLKSWLETYPESDLHPFALLAYFLASGNDKEKMDTVRKIREEYPDTLEAALLRRSLTAYEN